MDNLLKHIDKHFRTTLLALSYVIIFVCWGVNLVSLGNNVLFSDESWYLYLLQYCPHNVVTKTQLLFNNVFENNILSIRLCCWFIRLLGAVFFAFALLHLQAFVKITQKKDWHTFIVIFCTVSLGMPMIIPCPSLNYTTLNLPVAQLAIGCFIFGVVTQRFWWHLLSGFFVSFLFPIMITNVVIIPVIAFSIFVISKHKIKDCLSFIGGFVLFIIYYFTCVESPQEVFSFLILNTRDTIGKGSSDYGVIALAGWLLYAFLTLFKYFLTALLLVCAYNVVKTSSILQFLNRYTKMAIYAVLSLTILVYSQRFMGPEPTTGNFLFDLNFAWIVLFAITILEFNHRGNKLNTDRTKMVIYGLLLLAPVCLFFGTNISFYIKVRSFMAFVTPLIGALLLLHNSLNRKLFLLVLIVIRCGGLFQQANGGNWLGDSYLKGDKVALRAIGIDQDIFVDSLHIKTLDSCRMIIPKGSTVCNDHFCWGIVTLLEYKPVLPDFVIQRNGYPFVIEIINEEIEKTGKAWAICSKDNDYLSKIFPKTSTDSILVHSCGEVWVFEILSRM